MQEIIDKICEFIDELVELMQEDWERFKKFVKEYKNYVFWFFVLLITMQFTDIITLGKYVEKMCNENMKIQKGGDKNQVFNLFDNNAPAKIQAQITEETKGIPQVNKEAEARKQKKAQGAEAFEKGKALGQKQSEEAKDKSQKGKDLLKEMEQEQKQGQQEGETKAKSAGKDDELKQVDKQLSFFQQMKQKLSGVQGQRAGLVGPLFGGLDKVMDYMQNIMAIITFILTFIGIISLPVFIFLIASYFVIKTIATKLFFL
jgi:hypothetical protein